MSDPCCAHLHVSYQTETLPNVGTHGWWACDDCNKRFAPISNTLIDGETVRPVDPEPGEDRPAQVAPELVLPSVYVGGIHGTYSPSGIEIPRPEEEVRKEVLAECGYTDDGIRFANGSFIATGGEAYQGTEMFPQEIEEPAPVSWWARVWRWFR